MEHFEITLPMIGSLVLILLTIISFLLQRIYADQKASNKTLISEVKAVKETLAEHRDDVTHGFARAEISLLENKNEVKIVAERVKTQERTLEDLNGLGHKVRELEQTIKQFTAIPQAGAH